MIKVERYTQNNKVTWDSFIRSSKNHSFLFFRDFMDYHSDRFIDYSLMIYDEKKQRCNIMIFDHKKTIRNTHRIVYVGENKRFDVEKKKIT